LLNFSTSTMHLLCIAQWVSRV